MNFVKRAGLYCFRHPIKNLILFLLLTLMAAFLLTGIALRDASALAATDMQKSVGGKIFLEIDMDGHMGSGQENQWGTTYIYNGDYITPDIVKAISKVKGVVGSNVEETESFFGSAVDFKYLPASFDVSYTPYGQDAAYTATLSSEKCSDFESGKYKLISGRHITADDKYVVLISKELADYNKLSVGNTITLYSMGAASAKEENQFQIIGIFDGTEGLGKDALLAGDLPANCGYVSYAAVNEIYDIDESEGYSQLTIYAEDPVSIQNVYDKISNLPELKGKTLKLTMDTSQYDLISEPLDSLRSTVTAAIVIISLVSTAILILFLTIRIRGRKKEIGILLSVGMDKKSIFAQLLTEVLLIALAAFASSIALGNLIVSQAGNLLVSRAAPSNAIHVQIEAAYLLPVYITGVLLIAVSVTASSWTVIRLQPKDILSKMS